MIIRIFRFIWALIKYLCFGSAVSTTVYQHRLGKCNSCPQLAQSVCSLCGCNVKWKAKWSTEVCPKNKW